MWVVRVPVGFCCRAAGPVWFWSGDSPRVSGPTSIICGSASLPDPGLAGPPSRQPMHIPTLGPQAPRGALGARHGTRCPSDVPVLELPRQAHRRLGSLCPCLRPRSQSTVWMASHLCSLSFSSHHGDNGCFLCPPQRVLISCIGAPPGLRVRGPRPGPGAGGAPAGCVTGSQELLLVCSPHPGSHGPPSGLISAPAHVKFWAPLIRIALDLFTEATGLRKSFPLDERVSDCYFLKRGD